MLAACVLVFFANLLAATWISFEAEADAVADAGATVLMGTMGAVLIFLAVWNCVWLNRYGQTLGKRACGIKIVRSNGEAASFTRLVLLRSFSQIALGTIPFLSLIDILCIFRESR